MINQIQIQNYQSHKDSSLELSPGVNAIIGSSDSGKSAIVRAIRWLVFNRPSGDSFRNWDGGDTKVSIKNDAFDHILRHKADNLNEYALHNFNRETTPADAQQFKAFGQSVPEEVQQALNLSEINIQSQHNPPFLLSLSPGEVARYLNEIVNLEKIDSSLLHANRRIKDTNTEIDQVSNFIDDIKSEIESLDWVESASDDLDGLETKSKQLEGMRVAVQSLQDWGDEYEVVSEDYVVDDKLIALEPKVDKLINLQDDLDKDEMGYHDLVDVVSHVQVEQLCLKEYDDIIVAGESVDKLIGMEDALDIADEEYFRLAEWLSHIRDCEGSIKRYTKNLAKAEKQFRELMPETCPLCGAENAN